MTKFRISDIHLFVSKKKNLITGFPFSTRHETIEQLLQTPTCVSQDAFSLFFVWPIWQAGAQILQTINEE